MADNVMSRTFFQPVYKGDGSGDIVEAADVVSVLLNAADGTHPLQNITVKSVSEDGRTIYWEYDATNQYARSGDVYAVAPAHQWECPAVADVGLVAVDDITATVTSFTVNGVVTSGSWPVTAEGAAALQIALNEALVGNGAATVVYVDTGTDYLQVYVMQTTATILIGAEPLVALP